MSHAPDCLCVTCAPLPGPIDPLLLSSRAYRDERAREWARAMRLPADAVESFVARMEVSWLRQHADDEAAAAEALEVAARRRGRAAAGTVSAPRLYAPRIGIPRAA